MESSKQNIYLDFNDITSKQRTFNALFGGRGIGKTYGSKMFFIDKFLKDKSQFVWLRRYKAEKKIASTGFFNKVKTNKKYANVDLKEKGSKFYINGELAGVCIALSQYTVNKGFEELTNIKYILFEEYIIDNSSPFYRYMMNEMRIFFDLVETLTRLDEVTIFFISNLVSENNPLCNMFHISLKNGEKQMTKDLLFWNLETSKELIEKKENKTFNRIVKEYDPEYYNYAIGKSKLVDENSNIIKPPSQAVQLAGLICNGKRLYLYKFRRKQDLQICYYISDKGNNNQYCYAVNASDINENNINIKTSNLYSNCLKMINTGRMYYIDLNVKNIILVNIK